METWKLSKWESGVPNFVGPPNSHNVQLEIWQFDSLPLQPSKNKKKSAIISYYIAYTHMAIPKIWWLGPESP